METGGKISLARNTQLELFVTSLNLCLNLKKKGFLHFQLLLLHQTKDYILFYKNMWRGEKAQKQLSRDILHTGEYANFCHLSDLYFSLSDLNIFDIEIGVSLTFYAWFRRTSQLLHVEIEFRTPRFRVRCWNPFVKSVESFSGGTGLPLALSLILLCERMIEWQATMHGAWSIYRQR